MFTTKGETNEILDVVKIIFFYTSYTVGKRLRAAFSCKTGKQKDVLQQVLYSAVGRLKKISSESLGDEKRMTEGIVRWGGKSNRGSKIK